MDKSEIKEQITKIKKSIIELIESNDKGALIMANEDLKYYESL